MSTKSRSETRHAAREHAFQVLYSLFYQPAADVASLADAYRRSPVRDTDQAEEQNEEVSQAEPTGFSWTLVKGVWSNTDRIDALIESHAHRWKTNRMGHIELTILRIAIYEAVIIDETPIKVAIDEAVMLTKSFASEGSASFINGVLDAVCRDRH